MSDANAPSPAVPQSPPKGTLDPAYQSFFACFNTGQFFEAHEVLEPLWLAERGRSDARFYQGLIQLAGAFVHFRNDRREPGVALLKLGRRHLATYPAIHLGLDVSRVRNQVGDWLARAAGGHRNPLGAGTPRLEPPLVQPAGGPP